MPKGLKTKAEPKPRKSCELRFSMLGFDAVFNILMVFAAVLVFLKVKKLTMWGWGVVLAPACIAILLKILSIFLKRA